MEILFISHKYPPATGGMEKFSFELVQGISKNATVHTIIYEGQEGKVAWFYKLKNRVDTMMKAHSGIKLIHLNDGLMTYFALWLKKKYAVPVVATFHGLDIVFPLPYFQKKIIPRFNALDGFACVSEATKKAAIQRGIDASKVVVINNGVDHGISNEISKPNIQEALRSKFGLTSEQKIIISIGRSVKRKGFSWFVNQVLPHLDANVVFILCGPNAKYDGARWRKILPSKWMDYIELMLGLPTDDAKLQQLASDRKHKFIKSGYLPFEEIIQLLKMAPIFIMPNIKVEGDMEGFGLVALEASMSECLVVASEIDGITNAIINGKNGCLLPSENPAAWIETLKSKLGVDTRSMAIEYKSYTLANYSWHKMCQEYYTWFKSFDH